MKKTLALCLIVIISLSLISIPSAKADFTISFNTSCTTAGTNCNDITLSIGTSGDSTPFRSFDGDAEGTGWLMTGTFPAWSNTAIMPNGTAGGFTMTIEGGTVSSQPLSLQFKSEDIDMLFLNDISSSGFLDYDPWLVPITHTNNASPPKFSLDYSTFARIQNPSEITNLNGTYTLSIEHRVRFLDGISGISGGDQTIAFSNYTFTNSNKGNSMLQSFITDTTTLTTSTKEFIRLNAVFYDRVRGELNGTITLTTGKYPRIEYQTFYDDVFFQNNWNKAEILNLTSCAGTFEDPCESGEIDLIQNFNVRSRWNFDFAQNFPNSFLNSDGYERWNVTSFDPDTGAGTANFTTNQITYTVFRTNAVFETAPKSIQVRTVANSNGGAGTPLFPCGIRSTTALDVISETEHRFLNRVYPTQGEDLTFVLNTKFLTTSNSNFTQNSFCNFTKRVQVEFITPDNISLGKTTINTVYIPSLSQQFPYSENFSFEITQKLGTNIYKWMDVRVITTLYNFTAGADNCTGTVGGCTVSYNHFLDTFASNYLVFLDENGDPCDPDVETCNPIPPPSCLSFTTDPAVALADPTICLIPPQDDFCTLFPTDPACVNQPPVTPTDGGDLIIGGDPTTGLGGVTVDCGTGTLDFTPIDFTNTNTATDSVGSLLTNIGIIMGCAPTLWIPLITLLGGIGGIAAFVSKDVAIHGMFAFIMVWAFFFAVVGFIPFWMALITAMGIIGLWILIGKRTLTTTTG